MHQQGFVSNIALQPFSQYQSQTQSQNSLLDPPVFLTSQDEITSGFGNSGGRISISDAGNTQPNSLLSHSHSPLILQLEKKEFSLGVPTPNEGF